jgi:hypothetical protein
MDYETEQLPEGDDSQDGVAEVPQSYKFGEKEYKREEIEAALADSANKAKWQREYTRRDQQLATQRQELEKALQLEKYLNEHPEHWEKVQNVFKEAAKPQGQVNGQIDPAQIERSIEMKMEQKLEEDRQLRAIKEDMADLKQNFKEHFEKDPDLDRKIVEFCMHNGIRDIRSGFKAMMFDTLKGQTASEMQKKAEEAKARGRQLAQPVGGKTAGGKRLNFTGMSGGKFAELMASSPHADALNGE